MKLDLNFDFDVLVQSKIPVHAAEEINLGLDAATIARRAEKEMVTAKELAVCEIKKEQELQKIYARLNEHPLRAGNLPPQVAKPHQMTVDDLESERDRLQALIKSGQATCKAARRLTHICRALNEIEQVRILAD